MQATCRLMAAVLLGAIAHPAAAGQAAPPRPATAPAASPAQPVPNVPRIIVQATRDVVEAAVWTPDSRALFTASGDGRELLLWDVASARIIDRRRLPSLATSGDHSMRLHAMRLIENGKRLRIDAEVRDHEAEDGRAGRTYFVDLATRRITRLKTPPPPPPLPEGEDVETATDAWRAALDVMGDPAKAGTRDWKAAEALLPPLPDSPDGQWQMQRLGSGFMLVGKDGSTRDFASEDDFQPIDDAAMSPDGRWLAIAHQGEDDKKQPQTSIDIVKLQDGSIEVRHFEPGHHGRVRWIDNDSFAVLPYSWNDDPKAGADRGKPPNVSIRAVESGDVEGDIAARCFVTPLPDGTLVGAGLANCRTRVGNDRALVRLVNDAWVPIPALVVPRDADIRLIAASPVGRRLVVVTRLAGNVHRISLLDTASWQVQREWTLPPDDDLVTQGLFSRDGRRLWLAHAGGVTEWRLDGAAPAPPAGAPPERRFASFTGTDGQFREIGYASMLQEVDDQLLIAGSEADRVVRIRLADGKPIGDLLQTGVLAAGQLPGRPLLWLASAEGEVGWFHQRTGRRLFTTTMLVDMRFVAVAPDGRYDTNTGPDADSFGWFIPDSPFETLPAQTFMRDFFEPRLHRKLVDCASQGNCDSVLKPVPPITGINRLLPQVRITGITPDPNRKGVVRVTVEASEAVDAASGRRSGLYGIKLMINDREVNRFPDDPTAVPARDLARWRRHNAIAAANGRHTVQLPVSIPSGSEKIVFSAYAFNDDRVKSATAIEEWQPPPSARPNRPRRVFVLTIGVNDYDDNDLDLGFAESDASLMGQLLGAIPGYEVRRASLVTTGPDKRRRPVTGDHIRLALSLLGDAPAKDGNARQTLQQAGHDVAALDVASPDDVVIISFSGHGYADKTGRFALLPSNTAWPDKAGAPDLATTVTADDLTAWLRHVNAGEMSFIIDACHAGASVETPDFKPGPMGDAGLGQLAWDKSMRILAATQADDVALEAGGNISRGLLTHTLEEGLKPARPGEAELAADLDRNGSVTLNEWLNHAVKRLPALSEEVRSGGAALAQRGTTIVLRTPTVKPRRAQEPSLFDFDPKDSAVVVRRWR
jgi:hypothetical protein